MPPKAPIVAVKLGKVRLTGIRPPSSQSARTRAIDPARSSAVRAAGEMPSHAPGWRAAPAAGAARPLPVTGGWCSSSALASRSEGGLERPEIPEVLDVQGRGIALDLSDEAVELEVGPCRLLAATIGGENALLAGLLEVRDDLLLELRLEVIGQPEPVAFFDDEVRVIDDRVPGVEGLLEQHLCDLLVRLQPRGVRHEGLVGRIDLRQRQLVELVGRLLHHEVATRDVEEGGLHVALEQGGGAHLGAGHEADLAELDALF